VTDTWFPRHYTGRFQPLKYLFFVDHSPIVSAADHISHRGWPPEALCAIDPSRQHRKLAANSATGLTRPALYSTQPVGAEQV